MTSGNSYSPFANGVRGSFATLHLASFVFLKEMLKLDVEYLAYAMLLS